MDKVNFLCYVRGNQNLYKMKRRNICVSFDALFQTRHLISDYMNWRYGLETSPENWESGQPFDQIINSFRSKTELSRRKVYSDYDGGFFRYHKKRDFELFEGAKETIKGLSSCYNLYVVTERCRSGKIFIEELLKRNNLFNNFSGIHCSESYFPSEEKDNFKTSFLPVLMAMGRFNMGYIDTSKKEVERSLGKVFVPVLFCPQEEECPPFFEKYEKARNWKKIQELFLFKDRE